MIRHSIGVIAGAPNRGLHAAPRLRRVLVVERELHDHNVGVRWYVLPQAACAPSCLSKSDEMFLALNKVFLTLWTHTAALLALGSLRVQHHAPRRAVLVGSLLAFMAVLSAGGMLLAHHC